MHHNFSAEYPASQRISGKHFIVHVVSDTLVEPARCLYRVPPSKRPLSFCANIILKKSSGLQFHAAHIGCFGLVSHQKTEVRPSLHQYKFVYFDDAKIFPVHEQDSQYQKLFPEGVCMAANPLNFENLFPKQFTFSHEPKKLTRRSCLRCKDV